MNENIANIIISRKLKKEIDKLVTDMMSEISTEIAYTVSDRLTMLNVIPYLYDRLIERLDWNIEYHQKQEDEELNETEGGDNE